MKLASEIAEIINLYLLCNILCNRRNFQLCLFTFYYLVSLCGFWSPFLSNYNYESEGRLNLDRVGYWAVEARVERLKFGFVISQFHRRDLKTSQKQTETLNLCAQS